MTTQTFEGQRDGETVQFIFRRHPSTARKGILFLILCFAIGFAPMLLWPSDARMFWLFLGFLAIGLLGLGYAHLLWYFSIYIVTDQRLRQVSQKSLFKKSVTDLSLDKIENITMTVPNVFAGLFGYGTILIQTAAGSLTISAVAKPKKIHNLLENAIKEHTK